MLKFWAALSGAKTYIVAAVTVAYGVVSWWNGSMPQDAAMAMIFGGAGLGALRHGVSGAVISIAEQLLPAVLKAVASAQDAAKKTAPVLLAAIAFGALSLSACSLVNPDGSPMTTAQAADFTLQVACGAYSSDKAPLEVAISAGLIDQAGADTLHKAEVAADAICMGGTPTDLKSAIIAVNNVAVQIVLATAEANRKQAAAAPAKS